MAQISGISRVDVFVVTSESACLDEGKQHPPIRFSENRKMIEYRGGKVCELELPRKGFLPKYGLLSSLIFPGVFIS